MSLTLLFFFSVSPNSVLSLLSIISFLSPSLFSSLSSFPAHYLSLLQRSLSFESFQLSTVSIFISVRFLPRILLTSLSPFFLIYLFHLLSLFFVFSLSPSSSLSLSPSFSLSLSFVFSLSFAFSLSLSLIQRTQAIMLQWEAIL